MTKEKDIYVKEMKVYLEQTKLRTKSCDLAIKYHTADIKNLEKLIALEKEQKSIIDTWLKRGQDDLNRYRKKKAKKKA